MGYPSDLTDQEWQILDPYVRQGRMGRPRQHDMRDVLNAIFYVMRTGCQWRQLPQNFPAWQTVYDYYFRWRRDGVWPRIQRALRGVARVTIGRKASPSAAVIDSRTVKTVQKGGSAALMAARKSKAASSTSR